MMRGAASVVSKLRSGAVCAAALLSGCAGGMTQAECAGADWSALGLADGAAGARDKQFFEHAKKCGDMAFVPDRAAYESGRQEGLRSYCTPAGGFSAGKSGAKYQSVCPAETEAGFLENFEKGARLEALRRANEKAIDDYDSALADLDQNQYLLGVAEKRYAKPSISNEDREHEHQEVEHRRREITRLEKALPLLLFGIESSRRALDAFIDELAPLGLPVD